MELCPQAPRCPQPRSASDTFRAKVRTLRGVRDVRQGIEELVVTLGSLLNLSEPVSSFVNTGVLLGLARMSEKHSGQHARCVRGWLAAPFFHMTSFLVYGHILLPPTRGEASIPASVLRGVVHHWASKKIPSIGEEPHGCPSLFSYCCPAFPSYPVWCLKSSSQAVKSLWMPVTPPPPEGPWGPGPVPTAEHRKNRVLSGPAPRQRSRNEDGNSQYPEGCPTTEAEGAGGVPRGACKPLRGVRLSALPELHLNGP